MHPACGLPFDQLWEGLEAERRAGFVSRKEHGNLVLYNYNQGCVYKRHWTPFTLLARGIVLAPAEKKVVALPFPKFFNYGEEGRPDFPIGAVSGTLVSEKMDGSLGIVFFHGEEWHVVTRGSFDSTQSQWAKRWLEKRGAFARLHPGTTYLTEIIYPENRVVVDYGPAYENIILLGAYRATGAEVTDLASLNTGLDVVAYHSFATLADIVRACDTLPVTREGFVLRRSDGTRLKFKGTAYLAAHKAQAGFSPLAVWTLMRDGGDLVAFRAKLPEEFYDEFDLIVGEFETSLAHVQKKIAKLAEDTVKLSNKEVALSTTLSDEEKSLVFLSRRPRFAEAATKAGKDRTFLFNLFKPTPP
jgi:RNA ligase